MRTFSAGLALVVASMLGAYPIALSDSVPVIVCAAAGLIAVVAGLVARVAWSGIVAAVIFCASYLIALETEGIAFEPFVLIEAILVFVLLESIGFACVSAPRVDGAVWRAWSAWFAGALGGGLLVALFIVGVVPSVLGRANALLFATGAVAALVAAAGILAATRRVT